ncbi:MAG: type II toxin-antitoxin system VapC family toxin [Gemmatimonadetes bacterium]|nr:type II toxin-antitoxin system VapC family toxin [Gemmatimonadota bacterium]
MLTSRLAATDLLVMDTHVWVWVSGEAGGTGQIRSDALPTIEDAARSRRLFVCAASVWEIALKAERGTVLVSGDLRSWERDQHQYPGVRILSIDSRLAIDSTQLPRWLRKRDGREHRDPNDRFIVATTRRLNGVLLTCDEEILEYARQGHLRAYDACP